MTFIKSKKINNTHKFKIFIMTVFSYLPFFIYIIYIVLVLGFILLIYKWGTKFISIKQEQNDLLREYLNKMDSK